MYINNKFCHPGHVTVKETVCSKDVELLAVSLRPYYTPREFSHCIIICVYVPPKAMPDTACDVIHATVARLQTQHTEAFFAITGDFNHVTLNSTLTNFHQFVDCATRKNKTIDLLYANVKDAYSATPLPPLGFSDHNLIHLQPLYIPKVQRLPVTTHTFRVWSPETEEALRDCFETTDWSLLQGSDDLEEATACTTDYINFCMDIVVPTKTIRCYPNNKPWVTRDVKQLLNRKKKLFKENNLTELRSVQRELKSRMKEAKVAYGKKVEMKMKDNAKEAWQGIKKITGCGKKRGMAEGDLSMCNDLNHFYNRFGNSDTEGSISLVTSIPTPPQPTLDNHSLAGSHLPHSQPPIPKDKGEVAEWQNNTQQLS
ncbi:uncharacterized protein LOC134463464 [Engraulis encrasicolus]|uniref:uncharacterized protein LOC134463464 n=1 Tax=Engraulis encrasicolus TaxID=184585 RepID=UPI002FD6D9C6